LSEAFTGERLVPGEVDADLWNEHISRYAFAASLCNGHERILDAGCGTGYGSKFLSQRAGSVLGIDASPDAIDYALRQYKSENTSFLVGLCEDMPVPAASADLIVAFEVIEHLAGWRQFLNECARVLAQDGILVVSTPNKRDYTESRGDAGPNPFHVHEFEFAEFSEELERIFPHVRIFGQNHAESIVFSTLANPEVSARFASPHADPEQAGFFVAVCTRQAYPPVANFVYVPESANVLRERERHIQLLRSELDFKNGELASLQAAHSLVVRTHRELEMELERSNQWAESRNAQVQEAVAWGASLELELSGKAERVVQLQNELAAEQTQAREAIDALNIELESRTAWARERDAELTHCVDLLHAAEHTIEERTIWAQNAQAEADRHAATIALYEASRWVKIGKVIHLGPLSR
jgi:SAM-dependent methyltransferase